MKHFYRDNQSGGWGRGRNTRGRNPKQDRHSDRPTMHQAICDQCGRECEVPFKPTGDRPVYCSRCFEDKGGADSRRFDRRDSRDSRRGRSSGKRMYEAVCDSCGNMCEVPFQPSGEKPVYCSNCFEKKDEAGERKTGSSKDQFDMINTKLDKILQALTPSASVKPTQKTKTVKNKKDKKPKKSAKKKIVEKEAKGKKK